ncbi:GIY-YIG nuclease family protein [Defluviimonas sp. WL0075]|uniref:GIY-YIG nuclease family protein n=1 Tax=Albidovulum sediminicola TaxID=2984331 RepID=A0ABT2Z5T2_9RHOB|nr:GIY-YIG nuclease family protein [Defluviimonas sp. WL0075]MCV2866505.1 GIY-YIG nuclease family protein [Defluviimonas sp. WL0075]
MSNMTKLDIMAIGFVDIGEWMIEDGQLTYRLSASDPDLVRVSMEVPNALYAFVENETILYIGKTSRSLRKRFRTYCRPGARQRTNLKNNANIKATISRGATVGILAFTPVDLFRYGDFEINLAAGLEDSLIRRVNPPWNGGALGKAITESAALEAEDDADATATDVGNAELSNAHAHSFSLTLGPTYYERGIVNVGVAASEFLGSDGAPCLVTFQDGWPAVASKINRTANRSGGVRIVGGNRAIAEWFQSRFEEGDVVSFEVLGRNKIRFLTN